MHTTKIANCILISLLMISFGHAKVGRQAILQSGEQSLIVAKGDIPTPKKYLSAIDTYIKNSTEILSNVNHSVETLLDNLQQNNLVKAKASYIHAHYSYEIIRPLVLVFGNADRTINARADYFIDGVKNPNFSGFHAVEYYLFAKNDPTRAMEESTKLLRQLKDLHKRVKIETILIPKLVQAAPDFAENILENKLSGADNRYSGADLGEIVANLDGIKLIMQTLSNFLPKEYQMQVQTEASTIKKIITSYQINQQYQPYSVLSQEDKLKLYSDVSQLAETLAQLRGLLSVDVYHKFEP